MIYYYDKNDVNEEIEHSDNFCYDMKQYMEESIDRLKSFAEDSIYEDTRNCAPEDNRSYVFETKNTLVRMLNELKDWCDLKIKDIEKIEVCE